MDKWSNRQWNVVAAVTVISLAVATFIVNQFLPPGAALAVTIGAMAVILATAIVALIHIRRNGQG